MLIDANILSIMWNDEEAEGWNGVILWWFYVPGFISTLALIMFVLLLLINRVFRQKLLEKKKLLN